ncbi:MAG: hypothetical protein ABH851_09520 [Methanobacteriota archaeon]
MKTEKMLQDTLKSGFDFYKKQFVALIIGTFVAAICMIFIITIPPLIYGLFFMAIKAVRGQTVKITDVFSGFNYMVRSYVLFIVAAILTVIGFVFLVIPGIALLILFQYAIVVSITEDLGGIGSLQRSVELARKNLGFAIVFWIFMAVVNAIGSAVTVGWLVTFPYTAIATVIAVKKLGGKVD